MISAVHGSAKRQRYAPMTQEENSQARRLGAKLRKTSTSQTKEHSRMTLNA